MPVQPIDFYYRRRYLDGDTGINRLYGQALFHRRDDEAIVFDYPWVGPHFNDPVKGRRGSSQNTISRPIAAALRLYLLPNQPLRLAQQYNADNQYTLLRVDFATQPHIKDGAIYQTDLYLDLFATPSNDYAILDEDEVEIALEQNRLDGYNHRQILRSLQSLTDLLEAGRLAEWLASYCATPFSIAALAPPPAWDYRHYSAGKPDNWPQEEQFDN